MTLFSKGHTMNEKQNKDWLNPKEVNQEFGFSVSTLAKWRMDNKNLSFSKIGKYIKYKRADIQAFLNSNVVNVDEVA